MAYLIRRISILSRNQFNISQTQNKLYKYFSTSNGVIVEQDDNTKNGFQKLLEKYKDKILFNSYLDREKLKLGSYKYYLKSVKKENEARKKEYKEKCLPPLPISMMYFVEKEKLLGQESECKQEEKHFQLPFDSTMQTYSENIDNDQQQIKEEQINTARSEYKHPNVDKWMTNYEYFDDNKLNDYESDDEFIGTDWSKHYGTPDPTVAVSRVPCGGCGALLHCSDPAIPGYLPSEIFKHRKEEELKTLECQRCHFLKEYNIALDVSVQPEEYEKLLEYIRHVKSLVLLMVDLLDFPCSIWPGIVDIIGTERPIIIVANKIDLLPGDSIGYIQRIKASLMTELNKTKLKEANIKYVALISAKTGYGVENLISAMFKVWPSKGDVFVVGCTNVGKSSLFNTLLQSDYCKVHAVDIVKRATVSKWPGTTLNLLKFPINRPSGWKIYERNKRLKSDAKLHRIEKEVREAQLTGKISSIPPALIGHIGRTFSKMNTDSDSLDLKEQNRKMMVLDENHADFKNSKWFYDTPGVIHPDQVLSLLTTDELLLTIPKQVIRPQTYFLHKGTTIFIGGLARIDLVDSTEPCRLTIFCAETLPLTVTKIEDADLIYDKFLGSALLAAPVGNSERISNWPGLERHKNTFEFSGEGPKMCCGDIVLSSVGWVAVTAKRNTNCQITAWTPKAKGIYRRYPSVLPYAINLKGKRIIDTPAYKVGKIFSENNT